MVKNMPNFLSIWADTKKFNFMNLLTEEVAKAQVKNAKKRAARGSCEWT